VLHIIRQVVRREWWAPLLARGLEEEDLVHDVVVYLLEVQASSAAYDARRGRLDKYVVVHATQALHRIMDRAEQPRPAATRAVALAIAGCEIGRETEPASATAAHWSGVDPTEVHRAGRYLWSMPPGVVRGSGRTRRRQKARERREATSGAV
jgi:hypothetical protein